MISAAFPAILSIALALALAIVLLIHGHSVRLLRETSSRSPAPRQHAAMWKRRPAVAPDGPARHHSNPIPRPLS